MTTDEKTIKTLSKIKSYPCSRCDKWKVGNLIVCGNACLKWEAWVKDEWRGLRKRYGYTGSGEE